MQDSSADRPEPEGAGADVESLLGWLDAAPVRSTRPAPLSQELVAARIAAGAREGRRRSTATVQHGPARTLGAVRASSTRGADGPPRARTWDGRRPRRRGLRATVVAAGLAVLLIVTVGLLAAALMKAAAGSPGTSEAAGRRAAGGPADLPVLALVGDETAREAPAGVDPRDRWSQVLVGDGDARLAPLVEAGAGYTTGATTLGALVARVPRSATAVVLVGGVHDARADPIELLRAATRAIATVHRRTPTARILLVDPVATAGGGAGARRAGRILRSAAAITGADWIEAPAGTASAAGQRRLADRLGAALDRAAPGSSR